MSTKPAVNTTKHTAPLSAGVLLARARYTAAQSLRVVWYASQYRLARSLSSPLETPTKRASEPVAKVDAQAFQRRFRDLFEQDRANIEAGLYPAPHDLNPRRLLNALRNSRRFFEDLPAVDSRRAARKGFEVRESVGGHTSHYPAYYLQNFHYQSGGWLTQDSARLYDTQVEILFGGAADAMRRIALGCLAQAWRGADHRKLALLDVACGNGRFLSQALEAFPRLKASGLDLSQAYINEAKTRLARWPKVEVAVGMAEAMPLADGAFDGVTCIYLFHELPPKIRLQVAQELARVVKRGGVVVFADSLQLNDAPELNHLLELFPTGFHEPFYSSYLKEDLVRMLGQVGLELEETRLAFLTKVLQFRKRAG